MRKIFEHAIGSIIVGSVISAISVSLINNQIGHNSDFFDFPWWLNALLQLFVWIPWIIGALELCMTFRDAFSKRDRTKAEIASNCVSALIALSVLIMLMCDVKDLLFVTLCVIWFILRTVDAIVFRKKREKTHLLKSPAFYVVTVVLVVLVSIVAFLTVDTGKNDHGELKKEHYEYEGKVFSSEKILEAWTGEFSEDELTKAISKYEKSYFSYEMTESEKSIPFFVCLNYEPAGASVVRLSPVDTDNIDVELDGYIDMQPEVTCISNNVAVDLSWWFNEKDSWCGNYTLWSYLLRVTDSDGLKHYYYFRVSYGTDNE